MVGNKEPIFADVTIWEYIEPIDRGDFYEDPLHEALAIDNVGETVGGGTQLHDELGIEFVGIEIQLNDLDNGLAVTKAVLEKQGVPKGSQITYLEDGVKKAIEFGSTECLAIFLDGIGLPPEVYENADFDDILLRINKALEPESLGRTHGIWSAETETAIFVYGPNAELIVDALKQLWGDIPLLQNSRIVVRYGNAGDESRTFRNPMH